jgi:hypothetical protein
LIKIGFLLPAFPGISFAGMTEKETSVSLFEVKSNSGVHRHVYQSNPGCASTAEQS